MTGDESLDFEDRIEQVLASRPVHFNGAAVSVEAVAWAIKAIEDAGVHPSLKHLSRVIGRHVSQRELVPLVNNFYRQRLEELKRRHRAVGVDHLSELYEVVSIQVRAQVQDELAEEFAAAKEAWEQVEHSRGIFQGEREAAARQLELAESIREALQNEMAVARVERGEALERAARSDSALAESQREVSQLNRRNGELLRKLNELSVVVERRASSVSSLREALTRARDREAAVSRELKAVASTLSQTRADANVLKLRLQAQHVSAVLTAQQIADVSKAHKKSSIDLKRARARIARHREAVALRKCEIRELKGQLAEQFRREVRLVKDLKTMGAARDRALGAAKSAIEDADHSRQMVERLVRATLASQRFAARGESLGQSKDDSPNMVPGCASLNQRDG